jgi:hypothetical protein
MTLRNRKRRTGIYTSCVALLRGGRNFSPITHHPSPITH